MGAAKRSIYPQETRDGGRARSSTALREKTNLKGTWRLTAVCGTFDCCPLVSGREDFVDIGAVHGAIAVQLTVAGSVSGEASSSQLRDEKRIG
jgi:hypothetical protein